MMSEKLQLEIIQLKEKFQELENFIIKQSEIINGHEKKLLDLSCDTSDHEERIHDLENIEAEPRLYKLESHYNQEIDRLELSKIKWNELDERINELEKHVQDVCTENTARMCENATTHERLNKLEKEIASYSDIEEIHRVLREQYKSIHHNEKNKLYRMKVDNIRDDLNKLLKLICDPQSLIGGRNADFKLRETTGRDKKAYKCPDCKGYGKNKYFVPSCDTNSIYLDCLLCKGGGIVWA